MPRHAALFVALAIVASCAITRPQTTINGACAALPIGAISPAPPLAWCDALSPGASTAIATANGWLDDFAAAGHTALSADYLTFEAVRYAGKTYGPSVVVRTKHFSHNGHWMVDLESVGNPPGTYEGDIRDVERGTNFGGAMMRPARSFEAVDSRVIVEVDVSAAMAAYKTAAWPELIVTTASAPTGVETDAIDGLGVFGGAWTYGCRLETSRYAVCDLRDASGALRASTASATELAAWRECAPEAADATCRDRFRLDLGATLGSLSVNGTALKFVTPLAGLPIEMRSRPLYVYFASWAYLSSPSYVRMHWGRVAVNR